GVHHDRNRCSRCPKSVFTFDRNGCSRSTETGVHLGPKYAPSAITFLLCGTYHLAERCWSGRTGLPAKQEKKGGASTFLDALPFFVFRGIRGVLYSTRVMDTQMDTKSLS